MKIDLDFRKNPLILSAIVDNLQEGVFTIDSNGIFKSWNTVAEKITGYSTIEILEKSCATLKNKASIIFGGLYEIIRDKDIFLSGYYNVKINIISKKGRKLPINLSIKFFLEELDTKLYGAICHFSIMDTFFQDKENIAIKVKKKSIENSFSNIIGKSPIIQEVFRKIRLAAESDVTVLITGESGTGKELAAKAIHELSRRKDKPFLGVNCSAIPDTLLESELFGHVKGSFTGAIKDKTGIFQQAQEGTLFLDEIGDVSEILQVKLLRSLQEKEIKRVGDEKLIKTNIRLITATNKNLKQLMGSGSFREDFYYRIRVFEIVIPPLRERKKDIPLLVDYFIHELNDTTSKLVKGLTENALSCIMNYSWPGNIRELKNTIEHAFVTVEGDIISTDNLPYEVKIPSMLLEDDSLNLESLPIDKIKERENIIQILEKNKGNHTLSSKELGYSRITLWKKMKKLKIAKNG